MELTCANEWFIRGGPGLGRGLNDAGGFNYALVLPGPLVKSIALKNMVEMEAVD